MKKTCRANSSASFFSFPSFALRFPFDLVGEARGLAQAVAISYMPQNKEIVAVATLLHNDDFFTTLNYIIPLFFALFGINFYICDAIALVADIITQKV